MGTTESEEPIKKATVYLIDDDEDDRMFTREAFESILNWIDIIEFSDGKELLVALESSSTEQPSLILLDINMPRMGGIEVLSVIRANPITSHIPVVIFSTSSNRELISQAYNAGANAYIVKPTSIQGYLKMVHATALSFLNPESVPRLPADPAGFTADSIMIIEDNSDHWNLMRLALNTRDGVNLVHLDGPESVRTFLVSKYRNLQPPVGLILLDLYLPNRRQGLDLIDTIREFFARENLPAVPIIIFSASDHKEDMIASYQRQANAYITKSVDLAASVGHLNDVCGAWSSTIVTPRKARY